MDTDHEAPHFSFSSLLSLPLMSKYSSQHLIRIKCKGKGVPEHTMKAYLGMEVQLQLLTS
jgi:hypothetical protein